jgi:hypothetical protein
LVMRRSLGSDSLRALPRSALANKRSLQLGPGFVSLQIPAFSLTIDKRLSKWAIAIFALPFATGFLSPLMKMETLAIGFCSSV